jgi:hypothetical protein
MWTIVNKDGFELALWQDSKLIGSYGNFFSGIRAGELARGAHAQKESYEVWVPESPHHFNIEGRSATDASDQDRKKLTMAERRITRAGHKGIAFVFDVAFSNGHAMWLELAPAGISASKRSKEYTKVKMEGWVRYGIRNRLRIPYLTQPTNPTPAWPSPAQPSHLAHTTLPTPPIPTLPTPFPSPSPPHPHPTPPHADTVLLPVGR